MELLSTLELAYDFIKKATPQGITVESRVNPNSSGSLPLIVVGATPPVAVSNSPDLSAAMFSIVISSYADSATDALHNCQEVFSNSYKLWRQGYTSEYGWITNIDKSSTFPNRINSTLDDEDSVRFDAILKVTARHHYTN